MVFRVLFFLNKNSVQNATATTVRCLYCWDLVKAFVNNGHSVWWLVQVARCTENGIRKKKTFNSSGYLTSPSGNTGKDKPRDPRAEECPMCGCKESVAIGSGRVDWSPPYGSEQSRGHAQNRTQPQQQLNALEESVEFRTLLKVVLRQLSDHCRCRYSALVKHFVPERTCFVSCF